MKIINNLSLLSMLFLFFAIRVHSENLIGKENNNQLKEVIVTATKTEKKVETLPIPNKIITEENILNSGSSRLNEIIQEHTGLNIFSSDIIGKEKMQMQGLDAPYIMILIDGQPLFGRYAGVLDLNRISTNNVEKIEIIKGASSCLYGSDAVAGVINVITKKPQEINEEIKGNFSYKLGNFNTYDPSFTIGYGNKKFGAKLFLDFFKTNKYHLLSNNLTHRTEPYSNYTFHPRIRINFSEKVNLLINSRLFYHNQEQRYEVKQDNYLDKNKINEFNNSFLINHTITNRLKLMYNLYITNYKAIEFLSNRNKKTPSENNYNQWFYQTEFRSSYKINQNTLNIGIGWNYTTLDRTHLVKKANLSSEYIFSQLDWFIKDKWNILLGVRYDYYNQYRSQWSPKIGVNYRLNNFISLKTSLGYGYKVPEFRHLYFDFTNSSLGYVILGHNVIQQRIKELINTKQLSSFNKNINFSAPLKPENSINFNFGSTYKRGQLSTDYNFFYNTIYNLIDIKSIAQKINLQNVVSYFNLNKIFTYGLESNSNYKFSPNFSVSIGYQYLIAKDETAMKKIKEGEVTRRDHDDLIKININDYIGLCNRSRHTVNLKINYYIPLLKTNIHLRTFYRSKYVMIDSNKNNICDRYDIRVKGYLITHLTINKNFNNNLLFQFGVNNLMNYTNKVNIPNLYGRSFFGKIQYQF